MRPEADPRVHSFGRSIRRKRQWGEALAAYEHALRLEPENAAALRGAAAPLMREKLNEKAASALEV